MEKRLSRFGVGPKINGAAMGFAALAGGATYLWPDVFLLPYLFLQILGAILLVVAIVVVLFAGWSLMKAYNSDRLMTSGAFARCRHPLYAAAILLFWPGVALLSRSWLEFFTPLVAYVVFKTQIHVEDEYLMGRFGKDYEEYCARVNELLPFPHPGAQ